MDCEQALNLISADIDRETSPEERIQLEAHLRDCGACRVTAEAFRLQDTELRQVFAPRREAAAITAERVVAQLESPPRRQRVASSARRFALILTSAAAMLGLSFFLQGLWSPPKWSSPDKPHLSISSASLDQLTARPRPATPDPAVLAVGDSVQTKAGERRRIALPDGSIVFVNQNSAVQLDAERHLMLKSGEVFVEVAPREQSDATFVVKTAKHEISARGTKFAVGAERVLVAQGKVEVDGKASAQAGQQIQFDVAFPVFAAPRISAALDWTKELMIESETPLIPGSQYDGGALIAVDSSGQEAKLTLRKYHIDVHIEDGFARTTIDQTYFNHANFRLEGTFYFPLPPDASLSRLAMYVDGTLMEGGMAERDYARKVYEDIVRSQRDPALLEWVDGSTFKMRVFPLEARQEKRIILSYTQKLPALYGRTTYRFPAGHSLDVVHDWKFHARVKDGIEMRWASDTHALKETKEGTDLLLDAADEDVKVDRDVAFELNETVPNADQPRFSLAEQDGSKYLMLRLRPQLASVKLRERRDWVFLFESAGDRDPLLARTQIDVVRALFNNAEHDDTFVILAAGTRVTPFRSEPVTATPSNVREALTFLDQVHLVGALDLGHALSEAEPYLMPAKNPYLVHVGGGLPGMGEHREDVLAKRVPPGTRYVGVGVGKHWSRSFMKMTAERTGGYYTQINPDEPVIWRGFELSATLNTPRLLDVKVVDNAEKAVFLNINESVAQGEELCAIARIDAAMPKSVTIAGTLDGLAFTRDVEVKDVAEHADYLPRTWAKLEIDRLLAENPDANKNRIVELSKAMYVMTPFTSLLVLENEEMYKRFNVDRGRKDHWAMYPCPAKIPVVYEPLPNMTADRFAPKQEKPQVGEVMQTILVHGSPRFLRWQDESDNEIRRLANTASVEGRPQSYGWGWSDIDGSYDASLNVGREWDYRTYVSGPRGEGLDRPPFDLAGKKMISDALGVDGRYLGDVYSSLRGSSLGRNMRGYDPGFYPPAEALIVKGRKRIWDTNVTSTGLVTNGITYRDPSTDMPRLKGKQYKTVLVGGKKRLVPYTVTKAEPTRVGQVIILGNTHTRENRIRAQIPLFPGQVLSYPELRRAEANLARLDPLFDQGLDHDTAGILVDSPPAKRLYANMQGFSFARNTDKSLSFRKFAELRDIDEMESAGPASVGLRPQQYSRPMFTADERLFSDLISYAPGMNTSAADIQAVLESEAAPNLANLPGRIDPAARKLIDKARTAGWQTLKIGDVAFTFDGSGRYAYERTLQLGLRERVVCDGKTLLHLYPELGIGARRSVSRFHRAEIAGLVPWVLPPVEDLAHGADVVSVDEHSVAISPRDADKAKDGEGKPVRYVRELLVFAEDGRLAERRLVVMPENKTLLREVYGAKEIEIFEGEDGASAKRKQEAGSRGDEGASAKRKLELAEGRAPEMHPDTSEFVVLPLPMRSRDYVYRSYGLDPNQQLNGTWLLCATKFDPEAILNLFASEIASHNGPQARIIFNFAFKFAGIRKLGFYTLLASCGENISNDPDLLAGRPRDPQANYLALEGNPVYHVLQRRFNVDLGSDVAAEDSFLGRLARMRDRVWCIQTQYRSRSWDWLRAEQDRGYEFVRHNKTNVLGLALLSLLQQRSLHDNPEQQRRRAEMWNLFADQPGLRYIAGFEEARALANGDRRAEARKKFRELYEETLKDGVLPALDGTFRWALQSDGNDADEWTALVRETASQLIAEKKRYAAVMLAWQCWQLDDQPLARNLLNMALDGFKDDEERIVTTLATFEFLFQTKQYAEADSLVRGLLENTDFAKSSWLWRLAERVAHQRGMEDRSLECLEKALDLEYHELPEVIDLKSVREDYGRVLSHYQAVARSSLTLKTDPPADLLAKAVRMADRWRALDRDGGAAASAADVLRLLGAKELAWEYQTTPLTAHAKEVQPWLDLAQSLNREGDFALADRAYATAFETQPDNPHILWDRAQNLRQAGESAEAKRLLLQLADGDWKAEHRWMKEQARWQAEK